MALAENSSDQKKLSAEKGIKIPKITSGQNKLPSLELNSTKSDDISKARETAKEKKKREDKHAKILDRAKKRFAASRSIEATDRKKGLEDLKFLDGQQWSSADTTARAADGRPCSTENRLPTFANQIKNDQRQNRPSINISPMGDKSSKKDAKILRGMIRAIERDSNADVAYDTGFASAVDNGWGYWRVMTEYENDQSFNKVIVIRPLFNPFGISLDPNRTPFGLDSEWGIISEMIPRDEFKREWPDAYEVPWSESGTSETDKDWMTANEIRIAEYYYFTYKARELIMLDNGHSGYDDDLDTDVKAEIAAGNIKELSRRTVQEKQLNWCKMTSIEILEEIECDGRYIPIIECIGTLLNINGKITKKGIIRDAKGPQQMINYYKTLEVENVALQPKAPWIMEEGQVEGHEQKWQQANKKSFSYLLYKGTNIGGKPAPPPQRQPFAGPPAAILAAQQGAMEALKAVTGIRFDATMSERMKDESGRAIRELNNNANLGAYHYIDNFGRALKNTGIVLCDLIPEEYDTKRIVAILDESGAEDRVMINPNMTQAHGEVMGQTPESSQPQKIKMFNPKVGRYQVTVTIGPSYATKRVEAMESQMEFVRANPQVAPLIADLIAKNSDWQGAEEIAARIAKTQPPNLLAPDREDMSPQTQALIQGLQQHLQQQGLQLQQMAKSLEDRQKDRDVMLTQISSKHETDMVKIASDLQTKMEAIAQKRDASLHGTIGRQLAEVAKAVKAVEQQPIPAAHTEQPKQQTIPAIPHVHPETGHILHRDKHGNYAYVGPNGELQVMK
jgi:hypothetical protein